jgi:tetratricopeptide (TPR) repeat protein
MSLDEKLDRARRARLDGDYRTAELLAREILDRNPIHAAATGFLGQVLAEHGDLGAAARYVEMALGLAPNDAAIRLNAAVLRERQDDLESALREAKRAAELDGERFEIWATYGNLLGKAGLFDQAAQALKNACEINASHPGAALLLAGACLEIQDLDGVRGALDLAEAASPGLPQTAKLRTHLARARNDAQAMTKAAERWLAIEPKSEEAPAALAYAWAMQGFYRKACDAYRPLAEKTPPSADYLAGMGRYVLGSRDISAARAWFERAIDLDPKCAEAHFGLARAYTFLGKIDEAISACRETLRFDGAHVDAYAQLIELTGGSLEEAELRRLKSLVTSQVLAREKQPTALYALGDSHHRNKEHDLAFKAWARANKIKAEDDARSPAGGYNARRQERFHASLKAKFPGEAQGASAAQRDGEPVPIFIVGMPRSGTTLLENAVAAHPQVAGGGELPAMPFCLTQFMALPAGALGEQERGEWRRFYLQQIGEFAPRSRPYLTDKQPSNFESIGLIRFLFPEARIIHIRRNPVDTGLSIFRRNFTSQWPYATDLRAIGHYYAQHSDLMEHWAQRYPGAVAFVQYETLIEDFEGELRRLLDYCGLPWDQKCLSFQNVERAVATFSAVQVRKGASKEHAGAAAPYRDRLQPLIAALEAGGIDLETGAKRQRKDE